MTLREKVGLLFSIRPGALDTRFDPARVQAFRRKFMASCDGHATQRILQRVFGEALDAHRKNA